MTPALAPPRSPLSGSSRSMSSRRLIAALAVAAMGCLPPLAPGKHKQDTDPVDTHTGDSDTWVDPGTDDDGDGYTVEDGDCDDGDAGINPGVTSDGCDGEDNDCDGAIDEDFDGDEYEPNDERGYYLGTMESEAEVLLFGYLTSDSDVDRFRFWLEDDAWSWFNIEAWLYAVPADADYALELVWVEDVYGEDQGTVASADDAGDGGIESLDWGGDAMLADGGLYEVVVRSSGGSSCAAPYQLQIITGGW
jgi:hypothetical protein